MLAADAARPSLALGTGASAPRRPALACGSLVKPATRTLIHTGSQNAKGPPLAGQAFIIWWRRRESNPRPQALRLRIYMLIRSIVLADGYPTGRENQRRSRMSFNGSTPGALHRELVRDDAWKPNAQARPRPDGSLLVFKQRVRSCRRWQL